MAPSARGMRRSGDVEAFHTGATSAPPGAVLVESAASPRARPSRSCSERSRTGFALSSRRTTASPRAYVNLCPHFRIPLAMDGRELTVSPGYIWCGFHSAQFRQDDGYCVDGPAKGSGLTPIPIFEDHGSIVIAEDAGVESTTGAPTAATETREKEE